MRVRLLGPVDLVGDDGTVRDVPGVRRKAVLAALALAPRRVVSADWLVELVWDKAGPEHARNSLQNHVSYLRWVLGDRSAIRAQPPGYVLDLGDDATDLEAAEQLIAAGSRAADPAVRVSRLRGAVA